MRSGRDLFPGFRSTALSVLLSAWVLSGQVQASDMATLESLKTSYEKTLKAISDDSARALTNWPAEYVAALTALQTRCQKKGDLDGWKDAKEAIDRFAAEKKVVVKDAAGGNLEVTAIGAKYRDISSQIDLEKSQKIMALAQKYLARLTALQTDLTKRNKMDEALAVNAEIKAVKASESYTAASFVLSAHEIKEAPKPEPSARTNPEPAPVIAKSAKPPVAPPPADPEPAGDARHGRIVPPQPQPAEEFKIYSDKKAPTLAGVNFKNIILRPTSNMGPKRKAMATAMLSSVSDESSESSSSTYSSSRSKSGSLMHRVRLNVRTTATDVTLENAIVVVEYYVKESASSGGKISPEKALVKQMAVPKINSQGVLIDCPEMSTHRYSYRYTSGYGGNYRSKNGQEFYGMVVSVFEADKTLVFQATSESSLEELAAKEMPNDYKSDDMSGFRNRPFLDGDNRPNRNE